jgi:hypothetical protein
MQSAGADPGFQVRGVHLKKLRRAEEGANILGVFRVKNHYFTPKNHSFYNYEGGDMSDGIREKKKEINYEIDIHNI